MTKNSYKMPKVKFINSRTWQVNYICYLASQIQTGNYQCNGFTIVPYAFFHPKIVYFPHLKFSTHFWNAIKQSTHQSVARLFSKSARLEVERILPIQTTNYQRLIKTWKSKKSLFFKYLGQMDLFQKELAKVESITILVTPYGTNGSFDYLKKTNGKINLFITHRTDYSEIYLAKTIILALLLVKNEKYAQEKWWEKQIITDFLLQFTYLHRIFNAPLINESKYLSSKIMLDSKKYLQRLGFALKKKFTIADGEMMYGEKKINRLFSNQEQAVLKKLIQQQNKTISFDGIAHLLWGSEQEEKFSLWAITKVIQKIRNKLKSLNSNTQFIYTAYGKGYVFMN